MTSSLSDSSSESVSLSVRFLFLPRPFGHDGVETFSLRDGVWWFGNCMLLAVGFCNSFGNWRGDLLFICFAFCMRIDFCFSSSSQPASDFFCINEISNDPFLWFVFFASFLCCIFLFSQNCVIFFSSFVTKKCLNWCSTHPYTGFNIFETSKIHESVERKPTVPEWRRQPHSAEYTALFPHW